MMKTICIIQARIGSYRLPGKTMMGLAGRTVVEHVIERAKKIKLADRVVLAVPAEEKSQPLIDIAKKLKIDWVQGPEHNVLERYWMAANKFKADYIVRITADCPLIDPDVCNQIIALALRTRAYYVSNVPKVGRTFPQGLDCEVFTWQMLDRAHSYAVEPHDKEHVTPWIVRNAKYQEQLFSPIDRSNHRWVVDTQTDLDYLEEIFGYFPVGHVPTTDEFVAVIEANPEITRRYAYNNVVELHSR